MRLRKGSVGYTFALRSHSAIKSLHLSAYGRNLSVWGPDVKHFNYGVTVNLKF
ncbi:MAG: hypothetical protein MR387_01395 [Phocaeicola plebeius]|nr:hypothetical protein [Phocaeicola plebeius]